LKVTIPLTLTRNPSRIAASAQHAFHFKQTALTSLLARFWTGISNLFNWSTTTPCHYDTLLLPSHPPFPWRVLDLRRRAPVDLTRSRLVSFAMSFSSSRTILVFLFNNNFSCPFQRQFVYSLQSGGGWSQTILLRRASPFQ